MPLPDLPAVKLPEGTRFFVAAFLAVFFYFFTRPKQEPEQGTEKRT